MRTLTLYFAFALGVQGFAAGAPRPSAALDPSDVVRTVVRALASNHSPLPNAGIYTAYHFASPGNRAVIGPYGHFLQIVRGDEALPLLEGHQAEFRALKVRGETAQQEVRLLSPGGPAIIYRFSLSRQSAGECIGCWMIDGVVRVP